MNTSEIQTLKEILKQVKGVCTFPSYFYIMGDWSFLSSLLDKLQPHSTVLGKVWMSVLFLFRLFILAAGLDKVWGDEQASMDCNIRSPGCKNACYNHAFPISHTRFWVLQILFVSTPTLIHLGHILIVIRRENKLRRSEPKLGKGGMVKSPKYSDEHGKVQLMGTLLVSYVIQLFSTIIMEVAFIVCQYYIYGFILMPLKIRYFGYPCRTNVECFITRTTEKSVFIVFMLAMSFVSLLLNIIELFYLMVCKIKCGKKSNRHSPEMYHLNEHKSSHIL